MVDQNNEHLSEICRLCGKSSPQQMEDIFDDNKDILEKISSCIPVVISPHDLYSHKICNICHETLYILFNFITRCLVTDSKLRKGEKLHIRTVHVNTLPINGPVECDICKILFTDMNLFDKHIEDHKRSKKITFTSEFTTNESSDIFFRKNKDVTPASRVSKECEVIKLEKSEIIRNLINETNEKDTYKSPKKHNKKLCSCNFCDLQFSNSRELKEHALQVHNLAVNAEWICKFCNKSMTTKVGLLIHERIHDGSKPYICEWCGNGFRSRANLTQHQVIHTGVRKYPCSRCNKRFSRRSFVETHMRVHTGERPYCCDICGYRFTQIGDMRRHRNKHQNCPPLPSTKVRSDQLTS